MSADISRIINVQGVDVKIDTCFGEAQCLIEFAPILAIDKFIAAGRTGLDPWSMLVGFERPMAALNQLGMECLAIARDVAREHKIPVFFAGKDAKRHRVYLAMLNRAGINAKLEADEDKDVFIRVA
jgi:hypothetical protein